MKRFGLNALAIGIALVVPLAAQAQSLQETVLAAVKEHPQQIRAVERHAASVETVAMNEAGYRPKADLTLGYGIERNFTGNTGRLTRREAGLSASQMLYDGYETKSRVEQSQAAALAESARALAQSEQIAYQVAEVYLDVLRRRQLLEATRENLASHQDTFDKISRRTEMGLGSSADQTQAQGRLALAKYNLAVAEGNLIESEANYERVVGQKPGELEMPDDACCELLPASAEDAKVVALRENPRMASAIADHETALAGIGIAESAMHPKVHLEIDATRDKGADGNPDSESTLAAMVRLRQNIYRGGADDAAILRSEKLGERARAQGEKDIRDLRADAEIAWNKLDILYRKIPELVRHETEARGTRDAYVKQFSIGQRTLLDLLDSENELFTASNELIDGRIDEQLARYEVLYKVGRLGRHFGLTVPEHPVHRNDQGELMDDGQIAVQALAEEPKS